MHCYQSYQQLTTNPNDSSRNTVLSSPIEFSQVQFILTVPNDTVRQDEQFLWTTAQNAEPKKSRVVLSVRICMIDRVFVERMEPLHFENLLDSLKKSDSKNSWVSVNADGREGMINTAHIRGINQQDDPSLFFNVSRTNLVGVRQAARRLVDISHVKLFVPLSDIALYKEKMPQRGDAYDTDKIRYIIIPK